MVKQVKPEVALFGGSFDPPHSGHQEIVHKALASLNDIDIVLVVPAYLNPFKTSTLADANLRLSWCHQLFDGLEGVEVSDYEILAQKAVYTAQSVQYFNQSYHVKYVIIGADNLSSLTQWHAFEWLNANVIWVIAQREGHPIETSHLRAWKVLLVEMPISSTQIRKTKDLQWVDQTIAQSVKDLLKGKTSDDTRPKN